MMIKSITKNIRKSLDTNKIWIFLGMGLSGWCVTSYMSADATLKAKETIDNKKDELNVDKLEIRDVVKYTWKFYAPPIAMGLFSTSCILMSNSEHEKRNIALAAGYSFSEKALRAYQDKIIEKFGETKAKDIDDEVSKEIAERIDISDDSIIDGDGDILCVDLFTGKLFKSDKQRIINAVNVLNNEMNKDGFVSLSEFYDELNITRPMIGDRVGWNSSNGLIDIKFTPLLSRNGKPYLGVRYLIEPEYDFYRGRYY